MSSAVEPRPVAQMSDADRSWIGVALALGGLALLIVATMLVGAFLEEGLGIPWERAFPMTAAAAAVLGLALVVGIVAYAKRSRAKGLLRGFWSALGAVALLVLLLRFVLLPGTIFDVE